MVVWVSGVQCTWHHLPFWPLLLLALIIIPSRLQGSPSPNLRPSGLMVTTCPPLRVLTRKGKKTWDIPKVLETAERLLENAPDVRYCSCSLSRESGVWLQTLQFHLLALGWMTTPFVLLCLGSPLCRPHTCHLCGAEVDSFATHGLNCRWSVGRHYCHASLSDIVHRALSSAKVLSRLEPVGV